MTEEIDLDETSRDLSRRQWLTISWLALAVISALVAVFTLPRGVLGLFVIGTGHGTSIVLTIVGAVVFAFTVFLLWRWSLSLRAQRVLMKRLNEKVAEVAGIIEADDAEIAASEEPTPPQS